MPTIWDVAKLAGVSKTTVSRVITRSGYVSPKTFEKVNRAMEALNYIPSQMAQGIRTGKTHTIAMFVPDYKNTYYNALYAGVEQIVLNRNYTVMICNTNGEPVREIEYAESVCRRNIDGIIYSTYIRNDVSSNYFMNLARKLPVIFMNDIIPHNGEFAYVLPEEFESTCGAVQYLYGLGCRRIAYLRMPLNISAVGRRYEGYLSGLQRCGLEYDRSLIYECSESGEDHIAMGKRAAKALMSDEHAPDAIMSANDTMAIGALIYLVRHGHSVPKDIRVIGFDNIDMCNIVQPTLTTLAQPTEQMGRTAAEMLIDMIEGGIKSRSKQLVFSPELVVREST